MQTACAAPGSPFNSCRCPRPFFLPSPSQTPETRCSRPPGSNCCRFLWMASAWLSYLAMKAKGSVVIKAPAPGAPPTSAPVVPTQSVAMV